MKTNRSILSIVCVTASMAISLVPISLGAMVKPLGENAGSDPATNLSLLVERVYPGSLDLPYSYQVAIYENLIGELRKTNKFQQVLREGDHNAVEVPHLLVLKTTVEKYIPGSETRRAVTTVSGATKLTVRSQLTTREGRIVLERIVDGDVLFFGSNLRATHNLANNIAKTIKGASLSDSPSSTAK